MDKLEHAKKYLSAMGQSIEGEGGHNKMVRVCCLGGDFGLEAEEWWDVVKEWNMGNTPPWKDGQLWNHLVSAYRSRREPWGCKLPEHSRPDKPKTGHAANASTHVPRNELFKFWQSISKSAGPYFRYWQDRGVDIDALKRQNVGHYSLARFVPGSHMMLHPWEMYGGIPWSRTFFRTIVPLFNANGNMQGLHARWTSFKSPPNGIKALAPAKHSIRDLCMMNHTAWKYFKSGEVQPSKWVIVEGEPDFLITSTNADMVKDGVAVLGMYAGGFSMQHADAIDMSIIDEFTIATHDDKKGQQYAEYIKSCFPLRFRRQLSTSLIPQ